MDDGAVVVFRTDSDALLQRRVTTIRFPRSERCDAQWLAKASRPWIRIAHPNLVSLHEIGASNDAIYLVCDELGHPSLQDVLSDTAVLSPEELRRVVLGVGSGLHYAHSRKIAHGSIHPAVIRMPVEGEVRLARWLPRILGPGCAIGRSVRLRR